MVNLDMPYTLPFMLGAMTNKERIQEPIYLKLEDSIDLLIDVDLMIEKAKLTEKQKEVVELYYFGQMTQEEVAEQLGITQQAVLDHINKIKERLNNVLKKWGELDAKYNIQ